MIKGKLAEIDVGDNFKTRLMAIINLSPTSFFKGSIKHSEVDIQSYLEQIIEEKADFIDVGAISSAPAFLYEDKEKISHSIEIKRLSYFFKVYDDIGVDIPVSVDTQSSRTADYALSQGARIINDISGFKSDPLIPNVVSEYSASAIIMACHQVPGDVFSLREVLSEIKTSIQLGINAGIDRSKIVIDPGLGSWVPQRNIENDFKLINDLPKFRELKQCILVGISRKSFIGKILNVPPENRLWGSLAATTVAIMNGAHIIRTHDVKPTRDVCLITDYIKRILEKNHKND
ncbi:MAG: dihydropteroate synthase [Promethearchaeota archaeon]